MPNNWYQSTNLGMATKKIEECPGSLEELMDPIKGEFISINTNLQCILMLEQNISSIWEKMEMLLKEKGEMRWTGFELHYKA